MTTKLPSETAEAVLALKALIVAIGRARPDGQDLLGTLSAGYTRIVLDERAGLLMVGTTSGDGTGTMELVETVRCNPQDEGFGALLSSARAGEMASGVAN
jgi:hypothetical protein